MKSTITRFSVRALSLLTAAMITLPGLVLAQEEGEAAAKQTNMLQKWVIDGGWTMIPLVILFFITIMLVVYVCMQLNKKNFAPAALRDELVGLMSECRVQSAIKLGTESPTYLGRWWHMLCRMWMPTAPKIWARMVCPMPWLTSPPTSART